MPCYAVIRLLRGLQTLDEIEEALKEAKWVYERSTVEIKAVNPYTKKTLTFRARRGGVASDEASEEETSMLRTALKAKEVKAVMRKKGLKLKKQERVKGGIKIRMGG